MKKLLISFILLIFIFNLFGYYIPYYAVLSLIRAEMSEKAVDFRDEDAFTKISFDVSEVLKQVVWTRKGKEFKYNNEMYDVVKAEINKNKVTYYCIHDKDEKELTQIFDTLLRKNSSGKKTCDIYLIKELSKYNLHKISVFLLNQTAGLADTFSNNLYVSIQSGPNLPPPKIVLPC